MKALTISEETGIIGNLRLTEFELKTLHLATMRCLKQSYLEDYRATFSAEEFTVLLKIQNSIEESGLKVNTYEDVEN